MTTVLVVDDAVLDQRLAGGFVEAAGYKPCYASDGQQALEALANVTPDIVLTDLQMPHLDGLELVRRMSVEFPKVPVILMTAHGSEEIAREALNAGATSYVPKETLPQNLVEVLRMVEEVTGKRLEKDELLKIFVGSSSQFEFGYEPHATSAIINYVQQELEQIDFCDEGTRTLVCTALLEALTNAIDHGNLELDSKLRDERDTYVNLGKERAQVEPYRSRRVYVDTRMTQQEVTFTVRDEGPGFDTTQIPDPTDPENLLKPSGRGIMLIRSFMDEVQFNDVGNEITMIKRSDNASRDD
ncbi:MAG TPA: hypothetical protein DCY79_10515 [Planctomycetaceae bacterium]|nr:hypothetical protein [Blastopirellula sp.]HAY80226.1 hypothetical protein [Planctomycetaceae bacterium]